MNDVVLWASRRARRLENVRGIVLFDLELIAEQLDQVPELAEARVALANLRSGLEQLLADVTAVA